MLAVEGHVEDAADAAVVVVQGHVRVTGVASSNGQAQLTFEFGTHDQEGIAVPFDGRRAVHLHAGGFQEPGVRHGQ